MEVGTVFPPPGRGWAAPALLVRRCGLRYTAAMSSDARDGARRYYEGSGRSMVADLAALAANPRAVVVLLPSLVALLKPVRHDRPQDWDALAHSPDGADAWYVHLLVGDLGLARRLGAGLACLPWLCFQRGARHARIHRRPWRRIVILSNKTSDRKDIRLWDSSVN